MTDLSRADLVRHLAVLSDDLHRQEPTALFPWALGRLMNEILKQSKLLLGNHTLVNTIGSIKENTDPEMHPGASNTTVGTVLGIVGQLRVALERADSPNPDGED